MEAFVASRPLRQSNQVVAPSLVLLTEALSTVELISSAGPWPPSMTRSLRGGRGAGGEVGGSGGLKGWVPVGSVKPARSATLSLTPAIPESTVWA